jgi:hypothetical protein
MQEIHDKVRNDKDVYLAILKNFINFEKSNRPNFTVNQLLKSYNQTYGIWSDKQNEKLYQEIKNLSM